MSLESRSLPTRGAWIEITQIGDPQTCTLSLPTRGAWIEIESFGGYSYTKATSLPTRGAWIEIKILKGERGREAVAPHTGSVD